MYTRLQKWSLVFAVAALYFNSLAGECEGRGRGTLMQWSYGTSFEGGPDLNEPIVTDRPDFTEASSTVGAGVVQLECGYTFSYDGDGDDRVRNHSFPETLWRIGMFADWFEFRVDWNYGVEDSNVGGVQDRLSGAEDLSLGVKLGLTPQEQILPETALILQMSVPTGGDAFSNDEVLPGFNYLYGWDITDEWSMGGSTQVNGSTDDLTEDIYAQFAQSWTLNRSWTEKLTSYTEFFTIVPISADTDRTETYFNGGFTYLINDDVQWDIRAGVGLNEAATDFFGGTGLSLRYY